MNSLELHLLESLLPWRSAPAWRVAFSGGLDSTVLLHLLVSLRRVEDLPPLSAIHIAHGLQPAAQGWPDHCREFCEAFALPLQVETVEVQRTISSLEHAARTARYAAFGRLLGPDEVLLTAQHRDDQAETLLFRLLRGSGLKGLAAMPQQRSLGAGRLLRPLLDVPRAELENYAQQHRLVWVEDPSNRDMHYARNYLRHQVIPVLEQQWPATASVLARTAGHLAEAQALLDELAQLDMNALQPSAEPAWLPLPSLDLQALRALSDARQRNVLRRFLGPLAALPDTAHWAGWYALRDAAIDAQPRWRLTGGELQRSESRVWWVPDAWLSPLSDDVTWTDPLQPLQLPDNGQLNFIGERPSGTLSIRYRQGGERLHVPGRGHRDLKRLLNEAGIPVFVRARLPLLYRGEELLAVANLPESRAAWGDAWQLNWCPGYSARGLS